MRGRLRRHCRLGLRACKETGEEPEIEVALI